MEYLDFELPIKELEEQLDKCEIIGQESDVDVSGTCKQIAKKLEENAPEGLISDFHNVDKIIENYKKEFKLFKSSSKASLCFSKICKVSLALLKISLLRSS